MTGSFLSLFLSLQPGQFADLSRDYKQATTAKPASNETTQAPACKQAYGDGRAIKHCDMIFAYLDMI